MFYKVVLLTRFCVDAIIRLMSNALTRMTRNAFAARLIFLSFCLVLLLFSASPSQASPTSTRYYPPPTWILGPWAGWIGGENSINNILDGLDQKQIPITVFHFDWYTWQTCPGSAEFAFSDALLQRLQSKHIRAVFWYVPMIDLSCPDYQVASDNHYFVEDTNGAPIVTQNFTGHGSWLNFDNPDAVNWLHGKWDTLLARTMVNSEQVTGGFYIDNVRPDFPHDTNVAYSEAYAKDVLDYTRAHIPDGDVVMKHFGNNTPGLDFLQQYAHTAYIGDQHTDFQGMINGINSVKKLVSLMPAPFNEWSGNAYTEPDSETYIRRLHWGALQMVMDNSPAQKNFPWQPEYTPQVLQAYKFYSTLHSELVPYLHSYDQAAYENNVPAMQVPFKNEASLLIGNEIFAHYVTSYTSSVQFTLPAGNWVNFWDDAQVVTGPKQITQSVPLGKEPIWFKSGAIIPLEVNINRTGDGSDASAGSLTLRVYPNRTTTFRYADPVNGWVTFESFRQKNKLTLCSQALPSQPLIYEIRKWAVKPNTVTTQNGAVGINRGWGSALAKLASPRRVQGSAGGWFYDAAGKTLWVKVTQPGTDCPS